MTAAVVLASLALVVPGDRATASFSGTTLGVTLHYAMTCGQPGPGPLTISLPAAFRVSSLRVLVRGARRPAALSGSTITVTLPKPPEVTCMSIAEGTLPVAIGRVKAPAGTYTVRARIRSHAFAARLRIR